MLNWELMAATDNVLVPLPGLTLPRDLPWRVKFIDLVEDHLRRMSASPSFRAPRFFGYYFRGDDAVAVTGSWTVLLDAHPLLTDLCESLDEATDGRFEITGTPDSEPDFVLVHDRWDGSCCLWRFAYGMRFVMAEEAVLHDGRS